MIGAPLEVGRIGGSADRDPEGLADVNRIEEFLAARDLSVSHMKQQVVVALVGPTKIPAKIG
jgi:hypothetical protein